jgi:hypothetical protein
MNQALFRELVIAGAVFFGGVIFAIAMILI